MSVVITLWVLVTKYQTITFIMNSRTSCHDSPPTTSAPDSGSRKIFIIAESYGQIITQKFMSCCHIIVWQKCEDSVMRLASTQGTQPAVSILEGNHINFGWTVWLVRIKKSPYSWLRKPEPRFKTCKKKFFFSGSSVCIWKSEKPLKGGRTWMKTDKTSSLFTHKSPHTMVEVPSSNMEIRKMLVNTQ